MLLENVIFIAILSAILFTMTMFFAYLTRGENAAATLRLTVEEIRKDGQLFVGSAGISAVLIAAITYLAF